MTGLEILRFGVGGALALAGCVVALIAAIALMRFRDVFDRIHGAALMSALAAPLLCGGLALVAWDGAMTLRLGLLGGVCAVLGPAALHWLAAGAHSAGAAPERAATDPDDTELVL